MSDKIKHEEPQIEGQTSEKKETAGSASGAGKNTQSQKNLNVETEVLEEREKAIALREKAIELKEKELRELEERLSSDPAAEKTVPGLEFEIDGEKLKFKDDAPKNILFGGKSRSQKELIKDENALIQLASNYSLIEKIN